LLHAIAADGYAHAHFAMPIDYIFATQSRCLRLYASAAYTSIRFLYICLFYIDATFAQRADDAYFIIYVYADAIYDDGDAVYMPPSRRRHLLFLLMPYAPIICLRHDAIMILFTPILMLALSVSLI
jgi:hypothetical protein